MVYKKAPDGHTEFGGGPGLIDSEARKDRSVTAEEELMEIYASNPLDPEFDPASVDLEVLPRPARYEWPDKATRAGTT